MPNSLLAEPECVGTSASDEGAASRSRWTRAARASENDVLVEESNLENVGNSDAAERATAGNPLAKTPTCDRRSWRRARNQAGGESESAGHVAANDEKSIEGHISPMKCQQFSAEVPPLTREGPRRPGIGCTIKLRRGLAMPQMGLGGGGLEGAEGQGAVAAALKAGYRLIDTALYYGTEHDIAAGIRLAGLSRRDVFITTKLLQKAHASDTQVRASLKESLKNLGSNYVDLYLIHNPRAGRIKEVWSLLLQLRDQGLARAVGVSNFGIQQLEGIRNAGLELPEVNQIEIHCWRQLPDVVAYHRQHGIAIMCMAPLARGRMFGQSELAVIARDLGRSEAEIAIRWSLQCGFIPIPKSINPARIISNTADGFDLSEKDMSRIKSLDSGYLSCTMASPCHELSWDLVADGIPHPDVWGGGRNRGGSGKGHASKGGGYN